MARLVRAPSCAAKAAVEGQLPGLPRVDQSCSGPLQAALQTVVRLSWPNPGRHLDQGAASPPSSRPCPGKGP